MTETNEQTTPTYTLNLLAGRQGIPQKSIIWQHFGAALAVKSRLDVSVTYEVHVSHEPNKAMLLSWVRTGDIVGFVCYDADKRLLWGYPV